MVACQVLYSNDVRWLVFLLPMDIICTCTLYSPKKRAETVHKKKCLIGFPSKRTPPQELLRWNSRQISFDACESPCAREHGHEELNANPCVVWWRFSAPMLAVSSRFAPFPAFAVANPPTSLRHHSQEVSREDASPAKH